MTTSALPKQYDPSEVEPKWLSFWLDNGFFHADDASATVPFSITLPPPNVTGSLHIGHALGSTMQDVLIRWRRMQGFNAMWMPGIDHASIAVHVLVEKDLKRREHKTRFDLGRDEFMRRAWQWKERSGSRISEQEKLMGFSLDWSRERFTMDDQSNRAVREAFVRLYEEGLIFRAKRMINWDPGSATVVSDLEVDTVEENGSLWSIRYPIVGASADGAVADGSGEIIVATTRPETMLGDSGVAVHPDDARYTQLVGKELALPLTGRTIPVVADSFVDPAFGSGAVKVTPAHDPNDYECSQRTGLAILQVIDPKGRIQAPAPAKYIGMTVDEARTAVIADLEAGGFLVETKPYKVPRGRSQRSGVVIEPMLMEQWWVKAAPLAARAAAAVEEGKTRFVPELWTKTYMHWMTNIKDWCISRQLWWGHRIPAWYCDACSQVTVARDTPAACPACQGTLRQDEDILDTWFSSALWPFSTLGWPDKTRALGTFYPNNVLVTGPDIIFFWVARMMMMGLHFTGKVPFRTVYLTSIVTDENGDKMSKTKGNVIDPLDVVHGATLDALLARIDVEKPPDPEAAKKGIKKHFGKGIPAMGVDSLRFALAALNTGSSRIRLSIERVEGYRNFINKLWNASRFALMNLDGYDPERFEAAFSGGYAAGRGHVPLAMPEKWILSRLQAACAAVDTALETFRFSDAANAIYHFVWDELCDWYIELAKPHLHRAEGLQQDAKASARRHVVQGVLATVLETTMRLLHPFAPYVTEEIWQKLPKPPQLPASLMITVFPRADQAWVDAGAEAEMQLVQDVAVATRMLRATYGVPPAQTVAVELRAGDAPRETLEKYKDLIERSARITAAISAGGAAVPGSAKAVVGADVQVLLPLGGLIDAPKEKARIERDLEKSRKEIGGLEKKLANGDFVARAPEEVVAEIRQRLRDEESRTKALIDALETLGVMK
ncbi:MAG TPA: valine--tRNA ligase [Kofleriaceae bacterium]|jgi:valyl-tRNA synthetase